MKENIKNWLEEHETVYGMLLLGAALCTVAFGGAYLGASTNKGDNVVVFNLYGNDAVKELTNK